MSCRILGLDMMPYSLGCELQLFREDSPFLTMLPGEFNALSFEKQHYAVNRAINICCKRAPRWFKFWAWLYLPHNGSELAVAVAEFRNYLADGRLQFRSDLPNDAKESARYLGEPEILRLYRFVCSQIPRDEIKHWGATAWDFSYSFAKMLSQGHAESAGNLEIYNIQKKTHDDYHQQCEAGRAAWAVAKTNEEKITALAAHPIIRELAGLEAEVSEFENLLKGEVSCLD